MSCRTPSPSPLLLTLALLAPVALVGCRTSTPDGGAAGVPDDVLTEAAAHAFRPAVGAPPADWAGPVFALSHDYPAADPGPCAPADCPWLAMTSSRDFEADFDSSMAPGAWENSVWGDWMETVKNVIREGQDDQLSNEAGFRTAVGGVTRWYHVPWMAYDPTVGREFIHGTTNERTSHLSDLLGDGGGNSLHTLPASVARGSGPGDVIEASDCEAANRTGFETWAVGVYNVYGGYALGQVFPSSGNPAFVAGTGSQAGKPMPAGLPFPEGTLVTKFLFTTATPDCVDYLVGAPAWTVNRHTLDVGTGEFSCRRSVQTVHLVQVDVAAVDPKSPTRWIYGTFAYNGKRGGTTVWDKLEPVGIQWGSDPGTWPATTEARSRPAEQSVLNVSMTEGRNGIYEHFGCRGRLAGPVDNKMSSCMSCHASAFAARRGISEMGTNVPSSFGFSGLCDDSTDAQAAANMAYFHNTVFPDTYFGGDYADAMNLDTSMQLAVAFTQYQTFRYNGQPNSCPLDS